LIRVGITSSAARLYRGSGIFLFFLFLIRATIYTYVYTWRFFFYLYICFYFYRRHTVYLFSFFPNIYVWLNEVDIELYYIYIYIYTYTSGCIRSMNLLLSSEMKYYYYIVDNNIKSYVGIGASCSCGHYFNVTVFPCRRYYIIIIGPTFIPIAQYCRCMCIRFRLYYFQLTIHNNNI